MACDFKAINTLLTNADVYVNGLIATYEDATSIKFEFEKDTNGYITKITNLNNGKEIIIDWNSTPLPTP